MLEDAGARVRVVRKHALSTTSILADGRTLWVGTSSGILKLTEPAKDAPASLTEAVRNAAALYRHGNDLWAAEGPSLWRVPVSGKGEGGAPALLHPHQAQVTPQVQYREERQEGVVPALP